MNKTKIEWVKNPDGTPGYTFNPITGCLNHDNGLCKGGGFPCYAYKLANGRLKRLYCSGNYVAPLNRYVVSSQDVKCDPFYPRFWEDRLISGYAFMQNHKPMGIFPCDMSDWCGIGIPESWSNWILEMARRCPQHRFYLLTKQPQNLVKFSPFPPNCWVGATCTSKRAINRTLPYLMEVGARLIYLSIEPFLEWDDGSAPITADKLLDAGIGWLVIGAQTKPTKFPKIEWVQEIVEAAGKAKIPIFIKDNLGLYLPTFPGYYQRQEMPK